LRVLDGGPDVRLSGIYGADLHLRCCLRHRQLRRGLDIHRDLFTGGLFGGRRRLALRYGVGFGDAHVGEFERRWIRFRQGQPRPGRRIVNICQVRHAAGHVAAWHRSGTEVVPGLDDRSERQQRQQPGPRTANVSSAVSGHLRHGLLPSI
jgi:hypothetical protein